jgi:hypothetical protein
MDEVVAEAALDAQVAAIDVVVEAAVGPENEIVMDVQVNLAADATIWTGSGNNALSD